jgi:hypothetical protein
LSESWITRDVVELIGFTQVAVKPAEGLILPLEHARVNAV